MRIGLINPVFPPSLWDFAHCRDLDGSRYPYYPLALPTLAGMTPPEHEVVIHDENAAPLDFDGDFDMVGITGYHIQKSRVFEVAAEFRRRGIRVVLGGPMVNAGNIDEFLEHGDAVFCGEAELTWPRFLDDLGRGEVERVYRSDGFVDMTRAPLPRYDLLDLGAYSTAVVETSRGCPYSCEFCEIPARLGKKPRVKSVPRVMEEVRALYELGADSIFFIDDNFVGSRKRAVTLLEALAAFVRSVDFKVYFICQFTINFSKDEELLGLFREANFKRVFIGVETPRRDTLAAAGKTQNTSVDAAEAVRRIQSYGLIVWCGLVVGFDTDDGRVFAEQLRLLREAAMPVAMIGMLQAIPGTPLHARLDAEGRLRDVDPGGIRGAYESMVRTNVVPRDPDRLDDRTLVEGYQRLVREAYGHGAFGRRLIDSLRLAGPVVGRAKEPLSRGQMAVVGKVLRYFLLTFDLRRSVMFVRVLVAAALHDRDALEQAVVNLIAFKHLRTYYENVARQRPPDYAWRRP